MPRKHLCSVEVRSSFGVGGQTYSSSCISSMVVVRINILPSYLLQELSKLVMPSDQRLPCGLFDSASHFTDIHIHDLQTAHASQKPRGEHDQYTTLILSHADL